jgi:hypothetical protein
MKYIILFLLLFPNYLFAQLFGFFPNAESHGTVTFNYTGAVQTWTVPTGVTSITVDAYGAQGGSYASFTGGLGGRVQTTLTVTPGSVLRIVVGGQPTTNATVYGYGGDGGGNNANTSTVGKAGGGLSGIFSNVGITQAASFVIAGGGGGSSVSFSGGAAGAPNGSNGGQANYGGSSEGGKSASQAAGGAAGIPFDPQNTNPTAGSALNGGNGGVINISTWNGGGGGGAGYFGGGGGAGGGASQGAGGGGASYVNTSFASSTTYTSGSRTGNGTISITY